MYVLGRHTLFSEMQVGPNGVFRAFSLLYPQFRATEGSEGGVRKYGDVYFGDGW